MKMRRAIIIDVRVSIIGKGTVVGLEDLTREPSENTGKRQATITCISEKAHLFFLSKSVSKIRINLCRISSVSSLDIFRSLI